ncbi:hypothetical protein HNV11_23750 (plasmid) [Spirosoma taeanense]|uniref:Lipoprotein n=1 Tax=Spirosoma taeanense TaxID=2735870 RepID=A0A6M5YER6_9BACT|nr:hypothetical protein [Spirosoma taeanense]QJW92489.1 hypothetical protein HNV11_23750 [Spirosoma taeanense]
MKNALVVVLALIALASCEALETRQPNDIDDTSEIVAESRELTDAEIEASSDEQDESDPNARESATATTSQYFQCKTDDGELYTPDFVIYDYWYATEAQARAAYSAWSTTSDTTHGSYVTDKKKGVKVKVTKGTQLVKSMSMRHGWHIVKPGPDDGAPSNVFEIKPGVKGTVELSWSGYDADYKLDQGLLRVSFKYQGGSGNRRIAYWTPAVSNKTWAQYMLGSPNLDTIEDLFLFEAETTEAKSVAIRVPRFKGYVFSYLTNREVEGSKPGGKDADLMTKKGLSITFFKKPKG